MESLHQSEESKERELIILLHRNNELLEKNISLRENILYAVRNGLAAGFAGAIGATILVSFVVSLIRPLEKVEAIGPTLERVANQLEYDRRRPQVNTEEQPNE